MPNKIVRALITGGNGDSIRIWDLEIESLMKAARRVAGRELSPQERRRYLKATESDPTTDK